MQRSPRLKAYSVWESYDIRIAEAARAERKWRKCLGVSVACVGKVKGFKGDRLCNACKNRNAKFENPGKY